MEFLLELTPFCRGGEIHYLVSFHPERVLFPLAASICGLACAAYRCTPPRNPLISLPGGKNPRFPIWKLLVSHPEFPDGH